MTILNFHLELTDDKEFVWWIDSPDVPGFYASAAEIRECRLRAMNALRVEGFDVTDVREVLVGDPDQSPPRRSIEVTVDEPAPVAFAGDDRVITRTPQLVA